MDLEEKFLENLKLKLIKNRQLEKEIKEKRNELAQSYKEIEEYKKLCPHSSHVNINLFDQCPLCKKYLSNRIK